MGELVFGALVPHPPIIIEAVGGRERDKASSTIRGLEQLSRDITAASPETIVFISPHGPVFEDGIMILGEETLGGGFANFGAPAVQMEYANDLELAEAIPWRAKARGIYAAVAGARELRRFRIPPELDHGVLVPLDFLRKAGFNGKIVVMGMAMFPPDELYDFGMALQEAVEEGNKKIAVVASGDLSHRLMPGAPAGYNRHGATFDRAVVDCLSKGDFAGIMDFDPGLVEDAGECGYRPLNILLGVFDGYEVQTKVYSYEGPFGVGYLAAGIVPLDKTGEAGQTLSDFRKRRSLRQEEARKQQHPLVTLAVESLEHCLKTGGYLREFSALPPELPQQAGVFVSIKKHGQLRGCIGTISATQPDLAREVIHNAVSAGVRDPRFHPVDLEELPELTFSVDVLGEEEEISTLEELDPQRYGVIVRKGNRSGLLLPNLEGIDTVEQQVEIARQKAGIGPGEQVSLSRFEVKRYK